MNPDKVRLAEDGSLYICGRLVGFFDTFDHDNTDGRNPIQLVIDSNNVDGELLAKVVFGTTPIVVVNYNAEILQGEDDEYGIHQKLDYIYGDCPEPTYCGGEKEWESKYEY